MDPEDDANRAETNKAALIDSERVVAEHLSSAVVFYDTNSFSVYGIVGTVIEKSVLASDGHNYKVTVTYGAETGDSGRGGSDGRGDTAICTGRKQ